MKALLIVDIPGKYSVDELKADVYINHKGFNLYKRRRIKLKPMPKRKDYCENDIGYRNYYRQGVNDTIDRIEGTLMQTFSCIDELED